MKNKSDIFRLAAVLYADSNDDVSTEKVYRRIIESIFIDNENKKLTLSGIIELINKKYSLIFSEEDIIKYINYKGKFIYDSNNIIDVNLEQGHFKKLKEKTSNKDLEYYIGEFCSSYKLDLNYCKNIIYEPTLKSKACLKCLYFTIIIFDLCRYLEYFSYLCTINQTE